MGKPTTLLERLCAHARSLGAESLQIENKGGREWVLANRGGLGMGIANFKSSSADAGELRTNLNAAARKSVRTVIAGQVFLLKVRIYDSFGEEAYSVTLEPAPKLDPSVRPSFTAKQGQYLAFIYNYTQIHREPPAEADLERYFRVSPASIHEMIKTLERNGLIERIPGRARSMRLCVQPEHLPQLELFFAIRNSARRTEARPSLQPGRRL